MTTIELSTIIPNTTISAGADELVPCLALFSQAAGKQYSALPPLKKLLFRYVYGLI